MEHYNFSELNQKPNAKYFSGHGGKTWKVKILVNFVNFSEFFLKEFLFVATLKRLATKVVKISGIL